MLDFSPGMLEFAKLKYEKRGGIGGRLNYYFHNKDLVQQKDLVPAKVPIEFFQGDVENMASIPDDSFDTIVDAFNLCTYQDPVKAVMEVSLKRLLLSFGNYIIDSLRSFVLGF